MFLMSEVPLYFPPYFCCLSNRVCLFLQSNGPSMKDALAKMDLQSGETLLEICPGPGLPPPFCPCLKAKGRIWP